MAPDRWREGRDGRSLGTPGTHGVSRALYVFGRVFSSEFWFTAIVEKPRGKETEVARGRKENGKKRGKKAGRSRGGTTRRRIWSSCRRGEGRRRGREKSFEARFFFGGQEARNWQSAKKEIVGKVVWLAEARPNRKRGAPCRLSETRYYYYSRRRKFRIPARSTFRSLFFFLPRAWENSVS